MSRGLIAGTILAVALVPVISARAESIDILKGQFAFDWFSEPSHVRCEAVTEKLFSEFTSGAFQCSLDIVTNTASGEPARVCTKTGGGAEYLVFQSKKSCEQERETQASNSEE